ncbi:uncharacterized protein PRCAT00003443001 [Priceomyces carsonii]|uniref:uncharacterized protein n=1 Tax=Priceomyces carsonii TaxID=28549 RepID=UPI002ED786ED|nr:unnamed protein product [Priceomyces carsonii]
MLKVKPLTHQFVSNLKTHEKNTDAKRNLILSILKSTTTKREARNYLNKYQNQFDSDDLEWTRNNRESNLRTRTGQRELFINRFLNQQNPFVNIYDTDDHKIPKIPLRIALFKINYTTIEHETWKGISETFSRLIQLGISPVVLLDYDHLPTNSFKYNELYVTNLANKISNYLGRIDDDSLKSTIVRSVFYKENGKINLTSLEQVVIPLYQGIIPIIQPIAFNTEATCQEFVGSHELLLGLSSSLVDAKGVLTLEKIVMIDPIGGIPSVERQQSSHVFINLSQEYSDIISELYIGFIRPKTREMHLSNLTTMNKILTMINSKYGNDDATGIITTPYIMSINEDQLNPIIYNVLTDRAVISSSLPSSNKSTPQLSTSIIKKGVDVSCYDAENFDGEFTMTNLIKRNLVNKERLVHLMNDSFGKVLDVKRYFERIDKSIATVVIVGDYDGAAIITWETVGRSKEPVAYLDKFAIAKKNQGLPGLADVIFKIILQSHPDELIWRSRKNNPVNKWYFERCYGSISSPGSQWKIFYTGDIFNKKINKTQFKTVSSKIDIHEKLSQYSDIGEGIPPSFSL